ncbi:hypothetical protein KQI63_12420 [bacterium]|nr:hypothetical protein [bacterium]
MRVLVLLLLFCTGPLAAQARSFSPEMIFAFVRPVWTDLDPYYTPEQPDAGISLGVGLWTVQSDQLSLGCRITANRYYAQKLDTTPWTRRLNKQNGFTINPAIRYRPTAQKEGVFGRMYLHGGVEYHHLRWVQYREVPPATGAGDAPLYDDGPRFLDQGGVTLGVGMYKGEWEGPNLALEVQAHLTLVNRSDRADYFRVNLSFGFGPALFGG